MSHPSKRYNDNQKKNKAKNLKRYTIRKQIAFLWRESRNSFAFTVSAEANITFAPLTAKTSITPCFNATKTTYIKLKTHSFPKKLKKKIKSKRIIYQTIKSLSRALIF